VRPVPQLTHRLNEAARLGFTRAMVPATRSGKRRGGSAPKGIELVEVTSLRDALDALVP
jgi:DNA repair protein RadA/Sms